MTREERALKNLKQMCSDGRYLGSGSYAPLEVLKDFEVAIKALEQEPILDKLRVEIEQNAYPIVYGINNHELGMTLYGILLVIDKYKGESEE